MEKKPEPRVMVYRNLHYRNKVMYSVKSMKTKLVIDHVPDIALTDAVFKVSEKGRQRVIKEKRKNVHAGVIGSRTDEKNKKNMVQILYNPYKFETFVNAENMEPVFKAKRVVIDNAGVWAEL